MLMIFFRTESESVIKSFLAYDHDAPKQNSANLHRPAHACMHIRRRSKQRPNYVLKRRLRVKMGKGSPYSITERRVPQLITVFGSQPAGNVSHKPGGRLPLLSARPAVTLETLKRAATDVAAW